jgi:GNAT superfamily N-acetyltransferase
MEHIRVTQADPNSEAADLLIKALSAELATAYPGFQSGDGTGRFKPVDVMIPRAAFVIAWLDDQPVGCGAIRPMDDPSVAEVKRMYVKPQARGKGVSRRVLEMLENLAVGYGYHKMTLETGNRQVQAIGLYESAGFVRIDCYGVYADEPLSLCYEKTL